MAQRDARWVVDWARPGQPEPDFTLLRVIGEGGMGIVYEARQRGLGRSVAVKILSAQAGLVRAEDFLGEAALAGMLEHPAIIPVHAAGCDQEGRPFYAMRLAAGTVWRDRMEALSERENLDLLMQVAAAMAHAHERGVVHRDLKPDNVIVGPRREVQVLDWGMAVRSGKPAPAMVVGTPAYMAPEQMLEPERSSSPTCDVYQLGAILWEIATGTPPHPGDSPSEILRAARENRLSPAARDDALVQLARRAMASDPADRPADAGAFADALRAYLDTVESAALAQRAAAIAAQPLPAMGYDGLLRAVHLCDEALIRCPGHADALRIRRGVCATCARAALRRGDLDLAAAMAAGAGDEDLLTRIRQASSARARTERRGRAMVWVAGGLGVALVIALVGGALGMRMQRDRLVAMAAERDRAEAVLSRQERALAREERLWRPVASDDFSAADGADEAVRLVSGAWRVADGALALAGAAPGRLMVDLPEATGFRMHLDRLADAPLTVVLGPPSRADGQTDGQVFVLDLDRMCTLAIAGRVQGRAEMPAPPPQRPQHLYLEWSGERLVVLADGQDVLRQTLPERWLAARAMRLVLIAQPGAAIDNLRIQSLGHMRRAGIDRSGPSTGG